MSTICSCSTCCYRHSLRFQPILVSSQPDSSIDAEDQASETGTLGRSGLGDTLLGQHPSLPTKSPYRVYVAKYSYDPLQFSPNENPDAELPLNAGDYVYIYGAEDEVCRTPLVRAPLLFQEYGLIKGVASHLG